MIRAEGNLLRDEIEQFLYYEARLLEENRLDEWLDLFTDDATYRLPVRESVQRERRYGSNQVIVEDHLAFDLVNDDKKLLEMRVRRLNTGLAHVELPEAITARMITNVEVEEENGEVIARSNFWVAQMRYERAQSSPRDDLIGKRVDRLVRRDGKWKIAQRKVILAQPVIDKGIAILL